MARLEATGKAAKRPSVLSNARSSTGSTFDDGGGHLAGAGDKFNPARAANDMLGGDEIAVRRDKETAGHALKQAVDCWFRCAPLDGSGISSWATNVVARRWPSAICSGVMCCSNSATCALASANPCAAAKLNHW